MIRRLIGGVLLLALLCSCALGEEAVLRGYDRSKGYQYVALGRYPQTADGETLPISWRVLETDGEKAVLCSEYILFARELHASLTEYAKIGADFGKTQLSQYLNGDFARQAFTPEELSLLMENGTAGKVFLLTSAQAKDRSLGLGDKTDLRTDPGLRTWGTGYAVRNGLFVYQESNGGTSPYWVMDQSTTDKRHGRCTNAAGALGHIESGRDNEGVRPVVHLRLDGLRIVSGTGTFADPFIVSPAAGE